MDILIISTILAATFWILAVFFLYSVIHTNRIEKKLRQKLEGSGKTLDLEIEILLADERDNYQTLFYCTGGAGIVFYFLPQIF